MDKYYLDDIDFYSLFQEYIDRIRNCGNIDILIHNFTDDIISSKVSTLLKDTCKTLPDKDLLKLAFDYFTFKISWELSRSPHIKKNYKYVFEVKPILHHFYIEDDMMFDYSYITEICNNVEDVYNDLLSSID